MRGGRAARRSLRSLPLEMDHTLPIRQTTYYRDQGLYGLVILLDVSQCSTGEDLLIGIVFNRDRRSMSATDVSWGVDRLDHNWGQRGAMEVDALAKKSGEVASGAMWIVRLRYFAAVPASWHVVPSVGCDGLDPRTRCFKIPYVDRYAIVRKTAGYLEILRTVTAG